MDSIFCYPGANQEVKKRLTEWENEITNLFLVSTGFEALRKITMFAYPRELRDLTFSQIPDIVKKNLRPKKKLVIFESTKFLASKQKLNEKVIVYIRKLREVSRFCKFEKLVTGEVITEDELMQLRLMCDSSYKRKILEQN